MDRFELSWMALGACRWLWVVSGGFQFSYGKILCLKIKRSTQLWGVFVGPRNNDAKVPLKQMTKFSGNSPYKVSLKKTLGG